MAFENLPQDRPERYASIAEVRKAIHSLSDIDYVKLMIVARYFCKQRRLRPELLEPQELLHEAIKRTLKAATPVERRYTRSPYSKPQTIWDRIHSRNL